MFCNFNNLGLDRNKSFVNNFKNQSSFYTRFSLIPKQQHIIQQQQKKGGKIIILSADKIAMKFSFRKFKKQDLLEFYGEDEKLQWKSHVDILPQ